MNLHATATVPIAGITGLIRLAQDLAYSLICTHFASGMLLLIMMVPTGGWRTVRLIK